jgi:hypothetical protein
MTIIENTLYLLTFPPVYLFLSFFSHSFCTPQPIESRSDETQIAAVFWLRIVKVRENKKSAAFSAFCSQELSMTSKMKKIFANLSILFTSAR